MSARVLVRVPASSANLGPGFDVLAAALALHVEVEVEETGHFAVHTDLAIARDRRNLCVRAFDLIAPASQHEFAIRSDIPLSGGLGTSAAAIVAGLVAADALVGGRRTTCWRWRRDRRGIPTTSRRHCWAASCSATGPRRRGSTRRRGWRRCSSCRARRCGR